MILGVVIPSCVGREENLRRTVGCVRYQSDPPARVVVVYDGGGKTELDSGDVPITEVTIDKHEPGREQPRNVGVRALREAAPEATHVWFLDSDLIFGAPVAAAYRAAHDLVDQDRILIGPYDWLSIGQVDMPTEMRNDVRWQSFDEHGPDKTLVNDLGAGLACFGGNIVWPVDAFEHVGGFHPDLHHGRCEDGELGLRAASAGVPMGLVRGARAWHVAHPVDTEALFKRNARDVPLLNAWHPWIQERGILLTEKDGARFDFVCPECGTQVNSLDYWNHYGEHLGNEVQYADPASVQRV